MRNTMMNLASYSGTSCSSWWNGGLPLISALDQQKTLNSEMGNSNRITDLDSVSSHSQHDLELSESNFQDQCASVQSGDENSNYGAKLDSQSKAARSAGGTGVLYPPPSIDFRQPFACVPYPYNEPYSGGMFHSYGSYAVLSPNASGVGSPRVPLPRQPSDEELIFVNPKQYHGILRRRQLRAKLEAQRKLAKGRKPYLHESRHLHAMRRVRGSGGRFVNTKKQIQEHHQKPSSPKCRIKTTPPSSNSVDMFHLNQSNYSHNYSRHMSFNGEIGGGERLHHWISTALP